MGHPIKILWLCCFSNENKRSHLSLWKQFEGEIGQWIPNLLQAFEDDRDIEIHVVSTDDYMVAPFQTWKAKNITYHCYKSGMPLLGRVWPARAPIDHLSNFWLNRRRIRKIVSGVNPDLIHLFGVENPQYGAAVLDVLEHYPVLATIQGFIHRESRYHNTLLTRVRCRYEESLLRKCHHFSGDYESETVVRQFNPKASYHPLYFPVNEALISRTPEASEKPYDLLFVGGLSKQKGFGDFLEIVRLIVETMPDLVAAVVGYPGAYPLAMEIIGKNRLEKNICWLGRFPSQEGLFKVYRQSKLFLVPTYNDCFPSTIRESMLLGTPVIAYATGGIPWANRDGNCNVVIVPQGDDRGMADAALRLLGDTRERDAMAARAQTFAEHEFSLKTNTDKIRNAYQEIMESQ